MSKTFRLILAGLAAAVVFSPYPAYAKVMQGDVVSVKDDGSALTFKTSDPSKPSANEMLDVAVKPDTRYVNMSSLRELAPGDNITVDAEKNKKGIWEARTVKILKLRLHETVAATKGTAV